MNVENKIPDYALQPARAPKSIQADGIYSVEKITYPTCPETVVYQFEEDILVPDVKPDMAEILLMEGRVEIEPREKSISPKTDDTINLTGTITLETLYNQEGDNSTPTAMISKIPCKYQWNLNPEVPGDGVFDCKIKKLEYMIVNERKFRAKITLEYSLHLFCEKKLELFQGIKDDQLEMKLQKKDFCGLAMIKNDELPINDTFNAKGKGLLPSSILKENYSVMENYRQVTGEKIVINGFIFCNLLYSGKVDKVDGKDDVICQQNQRIEFTQFIPFGREKASSKWAFERVFFSTNELSTIIEKNEDSPEETIFAVKGNLKTRVEFYQRNTSDIVTDAFHKSKNFRYTPMDQSIISACGDGSTDIAIREIITLDGEMKMAEAISCHANIAELKWQCENRKVFADGKLAMTVLWKDTNNDFHSKRDTSDFRCSMDIDGAAADDSVELSADIKTSNIEFINEKQAEVNCQITVNATVFHQDAFSIVSNPEFIDIPVEKVYPMTIVIAGEDDTLWSLAKKYHTTEAYIKKANHIEGNPKTGQKLLIIK